MPAGQVRIAERTGTHAGTDVPRRLTVLGVDAHDPRLHTELHRYVPDDADALYLLAIPPTELDYLTVGKAGIFNPPATLAALLFRVWRMVRGPSLQSDEAVADVGTNRSLPVRELSVDGFEQIPRQRPSWTVSAWALTALVGFAGAGVALDPGPASALLVLIVIPLLFSFVLAHAGAHLRVRDSAILAAVRELARAEGDESPVVVVPERHAEGIADDAKDQYIEARARTVSRDLTADESLY